ncbi:hypothetical protein IBT47_26710 [Erwinia sp. S43]|nr:hypothetical protein [Erwinia sp. S43]
MSFYVEEYSAMLRKTQYLLRLLPLHDISAGSCV